MKKSIVGLGGSSLNYLMSLLTEVADTKNLGSETTPAILGVPLLRQEISVTDENLRKFLEQNVFSKLVKDYIAGGNFDILILDFSRDIHLSNIVCNHGIFTNPDSIKMEEKISIGHLFGRNHEVISFESDAYVKWLLGYIREFYDTLLSKCLNSSRKVFVLKQYPARFFFDSAEGLREMRNFSDWQKECQLLNEIFSLLSGLDERILFIEVPRDLMFASNTSPYEPSPFHLNKAAYEFVSSRLSDLADIGLNCRVTEKSVGQVTVRHGVVDDAIVRIENKIQSLFEVLHSQNLKLDEIQCTLKFE